ncbi:MAG: ATPase, partial [Bacillota bacterium]|nr:ATPase [Bacillota bacterium]
INGKFEDISFIKPIIRSYFDSLMKDINLAFNVSKGYIYLTGGGNKIFRPAFSNRFNNLIVSSNPFFDNAIGYEKVGNELWLKK